MKNRRGWRKYLVASWACFETLLFGGLLYGWASLVFVLKEEGIYADLCETNVSTEALNTYNQTLIVYEAVVINNTYRDNLTTVLDADDERKQSICKPQDEKFALAFTIGSVMFCIGSAVMGHVNYKFGTRVTRIIAMLLFLSGSLMMAFVTTEIPWLIFPGLSLIGIGGLPIMVTNIQISNLFDTGGSTFVGLLCGTFDMSSAIQLCVKIAFEHGISRKHSYIFISGLHSLVLVSTFVFLPKKFITKPEKLKDDPSVGVELLDKQQLAENEQASLKLQLDNQKTSNLPSLKTCTLSTAFLLHVVWLSLLQLRFYYFIGTLNTFLNRLLEDDKLVSYYTNVCSFIMMGGLLSSLSAGMIYDWQKQIFRGSKSKLKRELMPAVLPLSIASFMGIMMSGLVLFSEPQVLYTTFTIMTFCRSFLYSMVAGFLTAIFPSEYFGLLYGLVIISGGVVGFLQYGFFTWAESYKGADFQANITLLCLVSFSFVHPLYQMWKSRKAENSLVVSVTHNGQGT